MAVGSYPYKVLSSVQNRSGILGLDKLIVPYQKATMLSGNSAFLNETLISPSHKHWEVTGVNKHFKFTFSQFLGEKKGYLNKFKEHSPSAKTSEYNLFHLIKSFITALFHSLLFYGNSTEQGHPAKEDSSQNSGTSHNITPTYTHSGLCTCKRE